MFASLLLLAAKATSASAAPVLLGQHALTQARDSDPARTGTLLLGELGCLSCHRAEGPVATRVGVREAPRLDQVGARTTAEYLRRFVADPAGTKPGTPMPNLFAAWSAAERDAAVEPLVHFLASLGGPVALAPHAATDDEVERGRRLYTSLGCVACHGPGVRADAAPATAGLYAPLGHLASKTTVPALAAFLRTPTTTRPSGRMPDLRLSEAESRLLAIYLLRDQVAAGKSRGATQPAIPAGAPPPTTGVGNAPVGAEAFKVDPARAAEGRRLFATLGCVSCHKLPGIEAGPAKAPALAALAAGTSSQRGCMSATATRGAPWFGLDDTQRAALAAALARGPALAQAEAPAHEALLGLSRRGCLTCHRRDGVGGPSPEIDPLFGTTSAVDLGDEGRLPPSLDGVGSKLKRSAMGRIVTKGELHVRPYMATRMPTFVMEPGLVTMGDAIVKADARPDDAQAPELHASSAQVGKRLAGTSSEPSNTGLGCINCHNIAGTPAAGAPGPDLAMVAERVNPGWFLRWLTNPNALRNGTRMPTFWGDDPIFPEVEEGKADRQRAALWAYVALGRSMPVPSGMAAGGAGRELVPTNRVIIYRTYARSAGPRALVVGYPEKLNLAFDANVVRLAQVWRGRFWDASGTWTGRNGSFNEALGTDVLDLPAGPAVALLDEASKPWPKGDLGARNLGGRFLGYRLDDKGAPTFRYRLGELDVTELPVPSVTASAVALIRRFTFAGKRRAGLTLLAASGKTIEEKGAGVFVVDGKLTVTVRPALPADIRPGAGDKAGEKAGEKDKELRLAVPTTADAVELELQW